MMSASELMLFFAINSPSRLSARSRTSVNALADNPHCLENCRNRIFGSRKQQSRTNAVSTPASSGRQASIKQFCHVVFNHYLHGIASIVSFRLAPLFCRRGLVLPVTIWFCRVGDRTSSTSALPVPVFGLADGPRGTGSRNNIDMPRGTHRCAC